MQRALDGAEEMFFDQGATLVDVGGESSRPGGELVELDEELGRVVPVMMGLARHPRGKIPFSVDTRRADVAMVGLDLGAVCVNDVRFGERLEAPQGGGDVANRSANDMFATLAERFADNEHCFYIGMWNGAFPENGPGIADAIRQARANLEANKSSRSRSNGNEDSDHPDTSTSTIPTLFSEPDSLLVIHELNAYFERRLQVLLML